MKTTASKTWDMLRVIRRGGPALCNVAVTNACNADAQRLVQGYVEHYNNTRLNSAIGYITPHDMLMGQQADIHAERDRKLQTARYQRQLRRQQAA